MSVTKDWLLSDLYVFFQIIIFGALVAAANALPYGHAVSSQSVVRHDEGLVLPLHYAVPVAHYAIPVAHYDHHDTHVSYR